MKDFIVTPTEMKKIEYASQDCGVSLSSLMNNAGKCLAENVIAIYKSNNFSRGVVILAGNGNNAGDGFVCANILHNNNIKVTVIMCTGAPKTDLSIPAYEKISSNITIYNINDCDYKAILSNNDIIIDCIFGTGFHGEIRENISPILSYANSINTLKIACDIPSGANALNGWCSENTINCDYTITFGAKKIGMLLSPAREACGEITLCDIGVATQAYSQTDLTITNLNLDYIKKLLPKRKPNSHKGNYGKLINLCGSKNYPGAASLSTLSALRSGVGICTLASTNYVNSIVASSVFESIYIDLEADKNGQILFSNYEDILKASETATALLIGCGLGKSSEITELVTKLIENVKCPIILDADGINCILDRINILRNAKASIILTPHPGELARLLNISTKALLEKRVELSTEFAKEYGVTLVSKGAGTIITTPKGLTFVSTTGNAGLSRGGSGDVLAGMISSFVAQGLSPENAACVGVYLHGHSADRVAKKLSMQGMLPTDVINELPLLFKDMNR